MSAKTTWRAVLSLDDAHGHTVRGRRVALSLVLNVPSKRQGLLPGPRGLSAPRVTWRDAVRGARWGLEYLDLLKDMLASELISQCYVIRENINNCSG